MTRWMRWRSEQGNALVIVMLMGMVLTALVITGLSRGVSQNSQSAKLTRSSTSFQAAEAGVDDYVAKLTEDHNYFLHHVHPAEATRRRTNGDLVAAGNPWPGDLTWTYPNGKDGWRSNGNAYDYNLLIAPPGAGSNTVKITATGRRANEMKDLRAVETIVRPASIADFQRIVGNGDVSWGSTATTHGKLYAQRDIIHSGIAHGNLYAERQISTAPTYQSGATGYDSDSNPNIRTQITSPINFNQFVTSLVEIQQAAQAGGLYLNDTTADGWRLKFTSDGRVAYARCMRAIVSGNPQALHTRAPVCGADTVVNMPANGAIYSPQRIIVGWTASGISTDSIVDGRVTVVSNLDLLPAGNIHYETDGDDVLGLIARNSLIIPTWVPNTMTWKSANLAQTGDWHTATQDGSKSTMNHQGSTTTYLGGSLTMFDFRNYSYDLNLLTLPPPYFPVLEQAYTVQLFREVSAG